MEYLVAAYTDTGVQKGTNQDSICVRRAAIAGIGETVLAVVCDGMGGLKKGEVASASVVRSFGSWFDNNLSQFRVLCGADFSEVRRQWTAMVERQHRALLCYSMESGTQLGTTVAAFFAYGDRYLTLNIGDSRIYERKQRLRQLTQDQSLVAREIAAGRITEEESRHHPQRNILLQCLGTGEQIITPVFSEGKVQNDALYLLCSDGLIHELSSEEIEKRLQFLYLNSKESLTAVLYEATELCKVRGERDNITSILLKAQESCYVRPRKTGGERLKQIFRAAPSDQLSPAVTLLETAEIIHAREVIK